MKPNEKMSRMWIFNRYTKDRRGKIFEILFNRSKKTKQIRHECHWNFFDLLSFICHCVFEQIVYVLCLWTHKGNMQLILRAFHPQILLLCITWWDQKMRPNGSFDEITDWTKRLELFNSMSQLQNYFELY
jgi:hypothetical protein